MLMTNTPVYYVGVSDGEKSFCIFGPSKTPYRRNHTWTLWCSNELMSKLNVIKLLMGVIFNFKSASISSSRLFWVRLGQQQQLMGWTIQVGFQLTKKIFDMGRNNCIWPFCKPAQNSSLAFTFYKWYDYVILGL